MQIFISISKGVSTMKKLSILASMVLGLAAVSQAQLEGIGWDNRTDEFVGRLGLGGYSHLEIGLGGAWAESPNGASVAVEDANSSLSVSARYLLALHSWEKFTGFLHVGGYFRDDDGPGTANRAAAIEVFAGYEPEVVLLQHFAVSTRFGLLSAFAPDMSFGLVGDDVSIVSGFNFRILF
jgi:hypothetical protein